MTESNADPWAPWALASQVDLDAVFALESFEAQVHALLELAPNVSSGELARLPWEEKHTKAEFKRIRDAWADERARAPSNPDDAIPIEERIWNQVRAAAQSQDWVGAKKAHELLVQITKQRAARPAESSADDFSRLTELEVVVFAALIHKLRGEGLTPTDAKVIEYVALLGEP